MSKDLSTKEQKADEHLEKGLVDFDSPSLEWLHGVIDGLNLLGSQIDDQIGAGQSLTIGLLRERFSIIKTRAEEQLVEVAKVRLLVLDP